MSGTKRKIIPPKPSLEREKDKSIPDILSSISQNLLSHADSKLGISNEFIRDTLKLICPILAQNKRSSKQKTYFVDLKSSDSLYPMKKSKKNIEQTYIINLAAEKKFDSGHFVFIHSQPNLINYIDSFGKKCSNEKVRKFISKLSKSKNTKINFNSTPIQDENSVACGLFALLFVIAAEMDIDYKKFEWNRNELTINDKLCNNYIHSLLNM